MDASGRVLLPAPLREFAGLNKKAVLIGQGNKLELWDERAWYSLRDQWLDSGDEDDGDLSAELESLSF
jgi:MraZ protein